MQSACTGRTFAGGDREVAGAICTLELEDKLEAMRHREGVAQGPAVLKESKIVVEVLA